MYLCLVYLDEKRLDALSPAETEMLKKESIDYDAALIKRGRYLAAAALT